MLDAISEQRLGEVIPQLADKIRKMGEILAQASPPAVFRVTQGLRTWNQQAALYAQGRTVPGAIVTNAQPGYSYHQFGLAVDVVPFDLQGAPDWNPQHPVWQLLVRSGISLGLTAGAQFRSFPDYPHFQLTGSLPESPDDEVRQTFKDGGMTAVWQESGLMSLGASPST